MRLPLLTAIAALTLSGCQSSNAQSLPVLIPADLAQPCDPLPAFTGEDTNSLFSYSLKMAYSYHECEAKQSALAKWGQEINQ